MYDAGVKVMFCQQIARTCAHSKTAGCFDLQCSNVIAKHTSVLKIYKF